MLNLSSFQILSEWSIPPDTMNSPSKLKSCEQVRECDKHVNVLKNVELLTHSTEHFIAMTVDSTEDGDTHFRPDVPQPQRVICNKRKYGSEK